MEERERIRFALKEWEEKVLPEVKERYMNLGLFTRLDHIIDIVGVRRSGKTYLMYLVIKKLFENGLDKNSVVYINFENKGLYPLNDKLLDELLNYFFEKKLKKFYLFLDEIHNIKNWERWSRSVYDEYKGKIKLVVSGSTSRIMSSEVSSLMTGRHVPIKLLPLSFKEFLDFKGLTFSQSDLKYSKKKNIEIRKLFEEYMKFGGFPEVILTEDMKMEILRAYYEDILYKDVIEKFKVREINVLENFIKFLFSNISSYFSFKRGQEYLNSIGIKTSTRTLLKYVSILEETFLFFFLPIFTKKVKNILKYPRKIYCVDVGLRNVTNPFSEDFGKICENIIFLELKRRILNEPSISINYWKDEYGNEVDFVVRERNKVVELIQASWKIDEGSKKREMQSLVSAMEDFGLKEAKVLTFDFESEERVGKSKIYFIPIYKWLLSIKRMR